jgi:hypothetical protein
MKNYFDARFTSEKAFNTPLSELIWAFRNPHAHAFFPYLGKKLDKREVHGAVDWLYKDSEKMIGITIDEVERRFDEYKGNLYRIEGAFFRLCPQVLFVYFKLAVKTYMANLITDEKSRTIFVMNFQRLSALYRFDGQ